MPITSEQIENWFTHHTPKGDQAQRYEQVRRAAKNLAQVIVTLCPDCADTTTAVRKVREAVMTANAAIACNE